MTKPAFGEAFRLWAKLGFINFFPQLLGADGKPREELFVADKLHFSEAGYDIVTSCIKWQGAMEAFAKADAANPPAKGGIVFVGSSSIVRWKSLAQDFPEHRVVNRGFGGSNWQGIDDGWGRNPGLADALVHFLRANAPAVVPAIT